MRAGESVHLELSSDAITHLPSIPHQLPLKFGAARARYCSLLLNHLIAYQFSRMVLRSNWSQCLMKKLGAECHEAGPALKLRRGES